MPIRSLALLSILAALTVARLASAQEECTPSSTTTTTTTTSSTSGQITFGTPLLNARLNASCIVQLSLVDCTINPAIPVSFYYTLPSGVTINSTESIFLSNTSECLNNQTEFVNGATVTDTTDLIYWNFPNGQGIINSFDGTEGYYPSTYNVTLADFVKFASAQPQNGANLPASCPAPGQFTTTSVTTPTVDGGAAGDAGVDAGLNVTTTEQTIYLCIAFPQTGSTTTTAMITPTQFLVVTTPPPAPASVVVNPLNSGLDVSWTESPDVIFPINHQVVVTNTTNPSDVHTSAFLSGLTVDTTDVKILGLENGVTYTVNVKTFDDSGIFADFSDANVSSSALKEGKPVAALDFLQIYADDGGAGTGCDTGGISLLTVLGLGALLWVRRRSGRRA